MPPSATTAGWTGLSDPESQCDLERARRGGRNTAAIALFAPQGTRDPAIHAIVGREPKASVTRLGNVTAKLKRRGYTTAEIDKLWSGNVLRVWQAAIDARGPAYRPASC